MTHTYDLAVSVVRHLGSVELDSLLGGSHRLHSDASRGWGLVSRLGPGLAGWGLGGPASQLTWLLTGYVSLRAVGPGASVPHWLLAGGHPQCLATRASPIWQLLYQSI